MDVCPSTAQGSEKIRRTLITPAFSVNSVACICGFSQFFRANVKNGAVLVVFVGLQRPHANCITKLRIMPVSIQGVIGRISPKTKGMIYGFLGMAGFSVTLPATRVAVAYLNPIVVGLGRALVAAAFAAVLLVMTRQRLPGREQLKGLVIVALGVIVGFPLLSTLAMRELPASHAAIIAGILPLMTAIAAVFRASERPSPGFWVVSVIGGAVVIAFAFVSGAGSLQTADILLFGSIVVCGLGYAEGGRLARDLGGWQVIAWALVLSAPVLVAPVAWAVFQHGLTAPLSAWLGFGYVSLVSQFLAFILWYQGLALGGVARVSQIQLLQPFLTILAAALLLGEAITAMTLGFAFAVVAIVAAGRMMPVIQR